MIAGALLLLAANAASVLGASAILERVKTGRASLDVLLLLLIRLLLISLAVLAAGLTHGLTPWRLGLAGACALVVLLALRAHRTVPRTRPDVHPWLLAATLLVAARLVLQVWFFSPHLGDALAYHLPKIGEWIRAGAFTREMGLHAHVTFPAGFELVEAWWVVFLRHDALIEAAGAEFLAVAFAAVHALGRTMGLEPRQAWLAALAYALTPGLHLSATSCLNDTAAAALVVATAALIAARAPLPLVLMAVGLGIGVKATTGYALPGLVLLAFLVRGEPGSRVASRGWPGVLATGGLAAGLFWYARNLLWYGNPVYPVGEPGYAQDPVAVQMGPRWASGAANALDLLQYRVYDLQTALGANVDDMAGWGPAAFACGVAALVPAAMRSAAFRRLAGAFVVSLASCLFLIIHDPWCLKYVFFFPAIAALALPSAARESRSIGVIVGAAIAFSFVVTILPYDLPFPAFRDLYRQGWRERSALQEPDAAKGEQSVACLGRMGRAYLLYRPDFSRRVTYPRIDRPEGMTEEAAGARVAYFNPHSAGEHELLAECLRQRRLEPLGESFYRIRRP
jgi:hypothetical protein